MGRVKAHSIIIEGSDDKNAASSISRYHYLAEDLRMPPFGERINQSDHAKTFPS